MKPYTTESQEVNFSQEDKDVASKKRRRSPVKEYDSSTRNIVNILETDLANYKSQYEKTRDEKVILEAQLLETQNTIQFLNASRKELETKLLLLESTIPIKLKLEREVVILKEEKDRMMVDLKNQVLLKSCEVEGMIKQSHQYKNQMEEYHKEVLEWKQRFLQLEQQQQQQRIQQFQQESQPPPQVHPSPQRHQVLLTSPERVDRKRRLDQEEEQVVKKKKTSPIIVMFSGFKDTEKICTLEYKNHLTKQIEELGGTVRPEEKDKYDNTVTHIISAPSVRTIKTLAAAVKKKWIVSPEWVEESARNQVFVPEDNFGFCRKDDLFKSKRIMMTEGFKAQKAHVTYVSQLVEEYGEGMITVRMEEADMILIDKKDKNKYSIPSFTWDSFMNMIYPKKQ